MVAYWPQASQQGHRCALCHRPPTPGRLPAARHRIMRRALVLLIYALISWVGWLLLVWSREGAELITGAIAALLTALFVLAGCSIAGEVGAGMVFAWSRRLPLLSWEVVRGSIRVFGALHRLWPQDRRVMHRRGIGRLTALPLPTSGAAPRSVGQRALAIWEGSVAPDADVVWVELEGGRLVVRRFPAGPLARQAG